MIRKDEYYQGPPSGGGFVVWNSGETPKYPHNLAWAYKGLKSLGALGVAVVLAVWPLLVTVASLLAVLAVWGFFHTRIAPHLMELLGGWVDWVFGIFFFLVFCYIARREMGGRNYPYYPGSDGGCDGGGGC